MAALELYRRFRPERAPDESQASKMKLDDDDGYKRQINFELVYTVVVASSERLGSLKF